jgi:hypothetical protein
MQYQVRKIATLLAVFALTVSAACNDDGGSQTADGDTGIPMRDTVTHPDVNPPDGGGIIDDVSVLPNPSNTLSKYVEWSTTAPADTELVVTCGQQWQQTYTDDELVEDHEVFVMGLWDGASCEYTARSESEDGATGVRTGEFEAGPLPDQLADITVHTHEADSVQPGWTMFNLINSEDNVPATAAMVDHRGRYRWYHQRSTSGSGADTELRPMDDGLLFAGTRNQFGPAKFDWEGNTEWSRDIYMHHEIRPSEDGEHIYYLDKRDQCDGDHNSDTVVKYSLEDDEVVDEWVLCQYWTPEGEELSNDWSHLNTIEPFPDEEAFLLSSRNRSTLIKLDVANDQIDWRMGIDGQFGLEGDNRFFKQHAPEIQPDGNIVLFDNGVRSREGPHTREWSRTMEISYDTDTMEAEVVWTHRPDPDVFAVYWGDADRLDNGNTMGVYGQRKTNPERNSHIIEATESGETVWHIELATKWGTYRADRLVDPPVGYVK